ncbi:MAG: hypothetical protein RR382_00925 [Tannerellaceae bacterium]
MVQNKVKDDTASPYADDVAAFLNGEHQSPPEAPASVEEVKHTSDEPKDDTSDPDASEEGIESKLLDTTMSEDVKTPRNSLDILAAYVQEEEVPISREEQDTYLKATLFDKHVVLPVKLATGFTCECRTLSSYEADLLSYALESEGSIPSILYMTYLQQYKVALQVTKINDKKTKYLEFSAGSKARIKLDAGRLVNDSYKMCGNIDTARWNQITSCVNVFNHKISRLQAKALDKTFWSPVGTD